MAGPAVGTLAGIACGTMARHGIDHHVDQLHARLFERKINPTGKEIGATIGTIDGTVGGSAIGVHLAEQVGNAGIGYFSNEVQQAYQRNAYNLSNQWYSENKAW